MVSLRIAGSQAMSEDQSSNDRASKGCALGALFGAFAFPILWMIALYSIPVYDVSGEQVKNPSTLLATIISLLLALIGTVIFGSIGALIDSTRDDRREYRDVSWDCSHPIGLRSNWCVSVRVR